MILQALAEDVVNQSLGAQALPVVRPICTEVCVRCTSCPCKFLRTEDLVVLDLSAEISYSQAMYFAEEAAQFRELLTAIFQLGQMQVAQHLPAGVAKHFQKKTRQRR